MVEWYNLHKYTVYDGNKYSSGMVTLSLLPVPGMEGFQYRISLLSVISVVNVISSSLHYSLRVPETLELPLFGLTHRSMTLSKRSLSLQIGSPIVTYTPLERTTRLVLHPLGPFSPLQLSDVEFFFNTGQCH